MWSLDNVALKNSRLVLEHILFDQVMNNFSLYLLHTVQGQSGSGLNRDLGSSH